MSNEPDYVSIRPGENANWTSHISGRLQVDLNDRGEVTGVESVEGPVTFGDLVQVIAAFPLHVPTER